MTNILDLTPHVIDVAGLSGMTDLQKALIRIGEAAVAERRTYEAMIAAYDTYAAAACTNVTDGQQEAVRDAAWDAYRAAYILHIAAGAAVAAACDAVPV